MNTEDEMTVQQVLVCVCRYCISKEVIIPGQRSSQEGLEKEAGEMGRYQIPGTGYLCQTERKMNFF